jgi:hypothetical protein
VTDLAKLVARLEKVNEQLDKKQTKPLRDEQNDLMVKIQQANQERREKGLPDPASIQAQTVSGGTGVNGE